MAVAVNGEQILNIPDTKRSLRHGGIGLFVDIGTEAWFADLRITPN